MRGRPIKPDFVPALQQGMTIPLTTQLPAWLQLPTRTCWAEVAPPCLLPDTARGPYLALLPVGLALPEMLPPPRCALTAPFHPYLSGGIGCPTRQSGGLFSVALSVGLPRPGVTRHRFFWESGLSSILLPRPRPSSLPRAARLAPKFGWGQCVFARRMPSARIF